jgi:peptidyl-prolyl cis-trans isomerase A (cyclophilin A)
MSDPKTPAVARRDLLVLRAALAATPALAAEPRPPVRVSLTTSEGVIVLELYPDKAPITVANFLRYVDAHRFDGASFYRANRPAGVTDYGLLQGGLQNDPKKLFKPIAHESTTRTGILHKDGVISMGRRAPGTATADFFICVGDQAYLDADPKAEGDNKGFAAFGQVVEGMDVVKAILARPVSPTAGEGVMKGTMLKKPVPILKARRAG